MVREPSAHGVQRALSRDGDGSPGTMAQLETVSVPFLRKVPLLEGGWVDRYVVELAEYGSLLLKAK